MSDLPEPDYKEDRIQELEDLICQARHTYYNPSPTQDADGVLHIPVRDETYDAWVDELSELKSDSPAVTGIGATPVSEWKKVSHSVPMGSLNKVNTLEEFTSWVVDSVAGGDTHAAMGIMLLTTEKLDGISVSVNFENGRFVSALTRGDGIIGEDITPNVAKMKGIPFELPEHFTGSIRGEIILTKADHKSHFSSYANTRNAAAGISKRYDGEGCEYLTVIFYRVSEGKDFQTEGDQFGWLNTIGLRTPNWFVTAMTPGVKTPQDIWVEYQHFKRDTLDYDIDGLVISVNDLETQISMGEKDGRPKGSVAFKFAPITRESIYRKRIDQVGGTGVITPVAVFDPVNLVGTTVTNASLYNWRYIRNLGLGVGSKIIVARAGDVIPRVVSVRVKSENIDTPPEICPVCGAKTEWKGEYLICPNVEGCPAQLLGRIKRFIKGMGIKEWGDSIIERLIDAGLVENFADLYRLTKTQIAGIDRMGVRSAHVLFESLHEKNPVPLETLLGSLSIPLCAKSTIETIIDAKYTTWDHIQSAEREDFEDISNLGPVKAKALHDWINIGPGRKIMREFREVGLKIKERVVGGLTGMSFCFTGTMKNKRAVLGQMVEDAGGIVKNGVVKGLTCLVIDDPNSTSTKAKAARKNGTRCISEDEFLRMVDRDGNS